MRYIGKDLETIYIRCHYCKKIQPISKEIFYATKEKECPGCHEQFSFVWWCPFRIKKLHCVLPLLVMMSLSLLIFAVISFPFFQRYYRFNKAVTALNPVLSSILIPLLCSVISIFPSILKSDNSIEKNISTHGRTWKVVNWGGVIVVGIALIFLINTIMQTQYSSLQIESPDSNEVLQYYGNTTGLSASGTGRLFDSQGQLVYWGNFKNSKYDGYGEKFELIHNVHSNSDMETSQCVYRGEFKNGLPDGEGKEYRYDAQYTFEKPDMESPYLHYEGKFSEGMYCGYGTLYEIDSKYSGVFSEGKYNGYGEEWYLNSSDKKVYLFNATYLDGKLHGSGKQYWPNGQLMFNGTYEVGDASSGTLYSENGSIIYTGDWSNGKYSGKGILYWDNGNEHYNGDWEEGMRSGSGISYRENGTKEYEGGWNEDLFSNYGTLYWEDGETIYYIGRFSEGHFNWQGTEYYHDGTPRLSGEWSNGLLNGQGTWYWENGKKFYEGDYVNGEITGKGQYYSEKGELSYSGELLNGKREGRGTAYYSGTGNREWYTGEWHEDQRFGQGIEYDENHNIICDGFFENDQFIGSMDTTFEDAQLDQ